MRRTEMYESVETGESQLGPRVNYRLEPSRAGSGIASVLVPLDGGEFSHHALPLALSICRQSGAELRLVNIHTPPAPDAPPVEHFFPRERESRNARHAYLDGVANSLARTSAVRVNAEFIDGPEVPPALLEAANDADLVVMATHGRGAMGRMVHGSVANQMLRRLRAPLVLVPGRGTAPPIGTRRNVRRILVPLDGTQRAEQVLAPAVTLGSLFDASYTLMSAVPWPLDPRKPDTVFESLERSARRLRAKGLSVFSRLAFDRASAASLVLEFARRDEADLIALTTRRRGGFARLLSRSVAEAVVRQATVPVLISGAGAI